ncbi:alpha/beta fold hydrolase [Streptomyces flaveolus]|uniref:thioesterase II family protein n=1 Tax=Streptomyces flaveolus TaxID=67297 RepID=UPI0033BEC3EC
MPSAHDAVWFRTLRQAPKPRVRLVCFPHAGGAASFFSSWAALAPDDVELLAVRYPGREDRMFDEPAQSMEELAGPLTEACAALPADARLALFGHSMGAEVAYEVTRRLAVAPGLSPSALFLSGRAGPGRVESRGLGNAPDSELISELVDMGGTDAAVFADPELRELVLPALRADLRLLDKHVAGPHPERLDVPVRAYYGLDDPVVTSDAVSAWSSITRAHFSTRPFPGGHFYLNAQAAPLLMDVVERLG